MKKAVLFFADGTEEVEALTAVDILRRAGGRNRRCRRCPSYGFARNQNHGGSSGRGNPSGGL